VKTDRGDESVTMASPVEQNDMQRVVLVTGSTTGIGEACARLFAAAGDFVMGPGATTLRALR